jgi:hypothetical protein
LLGEDRDAGVCHGVRGCERSPAVELRGHPGPLDIADEPEVR